ncbi:MAG TPA: class C beta-lactamase-related serine hydrolase [Flavobacteriales bacterium]|nr:class C beta-lactamase-related serine hydrolase [Flavobacteriales bacterium]
MRLLLKIGKGFLIFLVLLNILILISGNTHVYKGIVNTYMKGKMSADIDEYQIFENREVKAGTHRPWPTGLDYNKTPIPAEYLSAIESSNSIAYLLIKNDSIRVEKYWSGYGDTSVTNAFSIAKTLIGMLVGIAIEEGKIESVEQKVGDFLPAYKEGRASDLTVKHLLTMSSGINFDESYVSPFAYPAKAYFGSDLKATVAEYEVTEKPGEQFEYLSGNTQLLSFVLEAATGKKVANYFSEKLWIPLGAKRPAYWSLDDEDGFEKAYCCFNSNARDLARLGQLYLKKGNWFGEQLVPSEYIEESIVPARLTEKDDGSVLTRYGYSWWMLDYKNQHIYLAQGMLGQYIVVIPESNIVSVRLASKRSKEKRGRFPIILFTLLDYALQY